MTITKMELAHQLMDNLSLSRQDAMDLVASLFLTIRETLAAGEAVRLSGFGNFTLRDKTSRPGRNPKTGEPSVISARRVVTFKASPKLRQCCNPHLVDEEA